MRWLANLLFRLRALVGPRRMQQDLDDEVAFHLEMETRKHVERGLSESDARRQAVRAFGGVAGHKERARDAWGVGLVHGLLSDGRYAFRQLRKNPLFSSVAVLTLALGIGGATAIFSVVNGVLLEPLAYPNAHRLVAVRHALPGIGADAVPMSPATYLTYRDEARAFDEIGLYRRSTVSVTGLAEPERVEIVQVTDGVFPLLGVRPALGRGYRPEDVAPGGANPVILSHGFWRRGFGGDPAVLGKTIRVNGHELEIVGVMPQRFRVADLDPALYLPLVLDPARVNVGNYSFEGVARLRAGATVASATRDVARLTAVAVERFGGKTMAELESMGFATIITPLREQIVGDVSAVLWVLLGTVGLVLLIACANVANLFLVRAERRRRDIAMRAALGASRGRVTRQLLTESLVIGGLGGVLGLGLAYAGLRFFLGVAPPDLPRLDKIAIDAAALGFTLGVSLLAGVLLGLLPVLRSGRPALVPALREGGRGAAEDRGRHRARTVFAVAQVALALVLLVGSGLMIRSFQALRQVRPGFERPEEVLTLRLAVPSTDAPGAEGAVRAHELLLERLAAIPGVQAVSAGTSVGMSPWDSWDDIEVEGRLTPEGTVPPIRRFNWIAPGYFGTLENPVLAGRAVTWDDIHDGRLVAMVTENLAREYWDDPAQAVGERIATSRNGPWREIVGVVGNEYTRGVDQDPPTVVYWPFAMADFWGEAVYVWRDLQYAIRVSAVAPKSLLPQVREAVWSMNPNIPLADVRTLEEIFAASVARTSFTLVMLGIAAAVALLLGTIGVFGVVSYVVSQRTREFGVRLAMGARTRDISRLVLRQGGLVGLGGVAIGLAAAVGLTRLMASLLFGVSPVDPVTYAAVSAGLVAVVVLASYLPARRAAGVDPAETLRWE